MSDVEINTRGKLDASHPALAQEIGNHLWSTVTKALTEARALEPQWLPQSFSYSSDTTAASGVGWSLLGALERLQTERPKSRGEPENS